MITIYFMDGTKKTIKCVSYEFRTNMVSNCLSVVYEDGTKERFKGIGTIVSES